MDRPDLFAEKREVVGKKVNVLRREGKLPAVLYGKGVNPTPIVLDLKETSRTLSGLTSSSLVTINLAGKKHAALVRDSQKDFIKGHYLHIDFQVVSLTEKIRANVYVEVVGIAPAVKDFNGVVVNGLNEIEVESLPEDLPERVVVDISNLMQIGDGIFVKDLDLSDDVTIHSNPDEMIVIITGAAAEEIEEEEELEEEEAAEEPEVIEKGKKEEEDSE